jgi:lipid-binding SYLF domain-containing protein
MIRIKATGVVVLAALGFFAMPASGQREDDCQEVIEAYQEGDPGMRGWFSEAYGYAVFPVIGKVGFGVGGARGKGLVYEQGTPVGRSTLTQLTVGFQWGGQEFSEVIFFKDKAAFDNFTRGNFELGAQISAVALRTGISGTLAYDRGVAVVTATIAGLMYEATVGGQKFDYQPLGG